jgi:alkanesulfonate monooxygenase SsuD/methylene tetrahydromethanopterin reductase-like flavin-dependent oxidoreductase (luciferase family)
VGRDTRVDAGFWNPHLLDDAGFGGTRPPLIVGCWGERTLALAARRANTVSLAGLVQVPGEAPGSFRMASASETDERLSLLRELAGDGFAKLELHALVQAVVVTTDRRSAAERLAREHFRSLSVGEVLETPFLLLGTAKQIAEQLRERRDRFGNSFITVHEPDAERFARVIEQI